MSAVQRNTHSVGGRPVSSAPTEEQVAPGSHRSARPLHDAEVDGASGATPSSRSGRRHGGNKWLGPSALALLVSAGGLKATPLLSWLPGDLTVLATAVVAVSVIDARLRGGPAPRTVAYPWLVFLLVLSPAALIAPLHTTYATIKVVTLFSASLVLALAPSYLLRTDKQRTVFIGALTVLAAAAGAFVAIFPTSVSNSPGRITLEGSNTIATARVLLAGALVLLVVATGRAAKVWHRLVLAAAGISLTGIAVLTGSRGPALALLVTLCVVTVSAPFYRAYRAQAVGTLLTLGVVGAWYLSRSAQSAGLQRILSAFTGDQGSQPDARLQVWAEALDMIQAHPFGTGWGSYDNGVNLRYPHNLFLEVGVEAGIVCLSVVIALIIATLVRSTRLATDWRGTALQGLLCFSLINAMVSSDINGNRLLIAVLFAIWAFPHSSASKPRNKLPRAGATPVSHVIADRAS